MIKAIIAHADAPVHAWVKTLQPEWDVQVPVSSIDNVWNYLEQGTLARESRVVLLSDRLFLETPEDFAVLVASFAPVALVIIIVQEPNVQDQIDAAVAQAAQAQNQTSMPVYYRLDTRVSDPGLILNELFTDYMSQQNVQQPEEVAAEPAYAEDNSLGDLEDYDPMQETQQPTAPVTQEPPTPAVPSVPTFVAPTATPAAGKSEPVSENYLTEEDHEYAKNYTPEELASMTNTLQTPGLVVSSTSSKGGSGKSTTALGISISLAMASRLAYEQNVSGGTAPLKIALVDLDVRDGQLGYIINVTSPSMLTLYTEKAVTVETVKKHMISVPKYEIDFLLAPKRGVAAEYLTPQFYLETLRVLRLMYDVVFLDTSVNYLDELLSQIAYPESDAILFITDLSKQSLLGMHRWITEVTNPEGNHRINPSKIGVVINRAMSRTGMDIEQIQKLAGKVRLLTAIPADNHNVTYLQNVGQLNELVRKNEMLGNQYFSLAEIIWKKTPLVSPVQDYLNSDEKRRDEKLGNKNNVEEANYVPMGKSDTKPPTGGGGLFGRKNR